MSSIPHDGLAAPRYLALILLAALSGSSHAATPAPAKALVARGEYLAKLICATCHVVAPDQEFAPILNQATPSFMEVANRPGTTADSLRRFISTTHWDNKTIPMTMPDTALTAEQMSAVTAYLLTLKRP